MSEISDEGKEENDMPAPEGNSYALGLTNSGRPTKYKPEFADQAYKLTLLGLTVPELATYFEVHYDTIKEWMVQYKEFSEGVLRGRDIADGEVTASFHKRAMGYRYEEVTYEKIVVKEGNSFISEDDVDNEGISVDAYKKKVVVKEVPPDPGAALNWLKNRQPKKWRDKQEIDHTTNGEKIEQTTIIFSNGVRNE